MTTTERTDTKTLVSTRGGNVVHDGWKLSNGQYLAECGTRGRFGQAYAKVATCEKCLGH